MRRILIHGLESKTTFASFLRRMDDLIAEVFKVVLRNARNDRGPHRRDAIEPAFDALLRVVDVVFPIELADAQRARRLVATSPGLSARDALHVAVMQGRDIGRIMSFDRRFDGVPGIIRIHARA